MSTPTGGTTAEAEEFILAKRAHLGFSIDTSIA